MKRRIQDAVFPDGLVYMENGEFGTPLNTNAFNVFELFEMDESQVVPLMISTWKPFIDWATRLATLKNSLSA